jgi:hypothetical protein
LVRPQPWSLFRLIISVPFWPRVQMLFTPNDVRLLAEPKAFKTAGALNGRTLLPSERIEICVIFQEAFGHIAVKGLAAALICEEEILR